MIGGLISCNMHLIASQQDSISWLIPAGSNSFLSESYWSYCLLICLLMLNASGCKREGWKETVEQTIEKNKSATFQGGGKEGRGLDHRAPLEVSQENRGLESYLKEARILPPSIALALSDMVMLIGNTGEGGHCTSMPQNITAPGLW